MMQENADSIAAAWHSLIDEGRYPSLRTVQSRLLDLRGYGASMRDIVPVVAALREKSLGDPRIDTVVAAFLTLDPVAQREAFRRMTVARTAGETLQLLAAIRERKAAEALDAVRRSDPAADEAREAFAQMGSEYAEIQAEIDEALAAELDRIARENP